MNFRNVVSPLSKENSDTGYWEASGTDGGDYSIHQNNQNAVLGKCLSREDHSTEKVCEIVMFEKFPDLLLVEINKKRLGLYRPIKYSGEHWREV